MRRVCRRARAVARSRNISPSSMMPRSAPQPRWGRSSPRRPIPRRGGSRCTAGRRSVNYLIDTDNAIIVDVEATTAIRQAEVLAARRMVERALDGFNLAPEKLIGDTAYGAAEMLNWLVDERGIEPHIPVWDKSGLSGISCAVGRLNMIRPSPL